MIKRIILLFLFVSTNFLTAQISSLSELTTGKIEMFTAIKEYDTSIYGYLLIADLGNVSPTVEKYEYIILDKNLNKVANGEFEDIKYKNCQSYFFTPEKSGNKLIISKIYSSLSNYFKKFTTHRILDLENNKLSEVFYFDKEKIHNKEFDYKELKKSLKKSPFYDYPIALKENFLLTKGIKSPQNTRATEYKKLYSISCFDKEKNIVWEKVINPKEKPLKIRIESITEDRFMYSSTNATRKDFSLHLVNSSTGETIYSYAFESRNSIYSHFSKIKVFEEKTIITGMYSDYSITGFNYNKIRGFFKITLDNEGKEVSKDYFTWEMANNVVEINENGKVKEGGYKLLAKQFFIFEDGSITFLTEKYKKGQYYFIVTTSARTTDFVIMSFDSDFKLKEVKEIEKDKSYQVSTDYLYSQNINGGKGNVFFYQDYRKDETTSKKNWILGIVSLIDGNIKTEEIPMSSEEYYIYPYIAKEGYILLREFNKNEDYDGIRLEKLNY